MNIIGISGLHRSVAFKKKHFPGLSRREYRIAQGFDSAAALVNENGVVAAASEERFSRVKTTGAFPRYAINYCLSAGNLKLENIDYIAHGFNYEPVKEYFEGDDHLKTLYKEVYAPEVQREVIREFYPEFDADAKFYPVTHHLAHAASAFYPSGYNEALILISDGMGEIHSITVAVGRGKDIEVLKQVSASHSLGILYGVFTLYLGFFFGLDEYKVMGLAPYGNPRRFYTKIMDFVDLKPDGTYAIPLFAENKTQLEKETHRGVLKELEETFGPAREPGSEMTQYHKDIAAGVQAMLQTCQMHVLRHFQRETGLTNLCMAGGVALNCTANGVIRRSRLFKNMFVQPAAGDDGPALGAALYAQRQLTPQFQREKMTAPLYGPEFDNAAIEAALNKRTDCKTVRRENFSELCRDVAALLDAGKIVAWFQGRMEYGPRALGNRSILADPRAPEMRNKVNMLIKMREGFRPFAPAVKKEGAAKIFDIDAGDEDTFAHMLYVTQVRPEFQEQLPAITHVNGSARPQTVSREHNPRFWTLIDAFEDRTGMPVVLNTSFNVKGQPIVCTPEEAIDTFLLARLDVLVLGDYIVAAKVQENIEESRRRSTEKIAPTLVGLD